MGIGVENNNLIWSVRLAWDEVEFGLGCNTRTTESYGCVICITNSVRQPAQSEKRWYTPPDSKRGQ